MLFTIKKHLPRTFHENFYWFVDDLVWSLYFEGGTGSCTMVVSALTLS